MSGTTQDTSALVPAFPVLKRYALPLSVAVLVIFHAVGLWGMAFSNDPAYFQSLTPLNLLLTNALLFGFHRRWNRTFILFALTVFAVGFVVEAVGVHTGLLFGSYSYGSALGYKLWRVPLLIGLNWLMLVYITGTLADRLRINQVLKAVVAAALMVLLDFFLEPVAETFDFWSWQEGAIPVFNYITWFAVAFVLQLYFQKSAVYRKNKLAIFVYVVQLFFFVALYSIIV